MSGRINVTRSSMPPFEEYVREIESLWDSRWLTNAGEKHNQLQQKIAEYLQVSQVSLFTNGHMALELLLQAMDLQGEVITTPFTFASTTHAIVRCGLKPVFCDVREDDCTLDPKKAEALINENTCAIVPVHVYGNACDVEAMETLADKYNLKVIYDAAHAFGVKYKGKSLASFGNASMYSFHATKVFHTIEGGAVAADDSALHERLTYLRDFGIRDSEHIDYVAPNAKMNEFSAAMGLCNLRHLEQAIEKRRLASEQYIRRLSGTKGIRVLLSQKEDIIRNYAYMPVAFDAELFRPRDSIVKDLAEKNIYARKYFYPLLTDCTCYSGCYDSSETPIAKRLSECVLTLPLYEDLSIEDVDLICDIILRQ